MKITVYKSNNIEVAYINRHLTPEVPQKKYAKLNASFKSIPGFDNGSDVPKNYKDVLKQKIKAGL
jgi:hypothetical protein